MARRKSTNTTAKVGDSTVELSDATVKEAPKSRRAPRRKAVAKPEPDVAPVIEAEAEATEPEALAAIEPDPTPESEISDQAETLVKLSFIDKVPRGFGQCEFIEHEPGRSSNRIPARPVNQSAYYKLQCPKAARLRLAALNFTAARTGIYCVEHVLAEIARSQEEQERLGKALARVVNAG